MTRPERNQASLVSSINKCFLVLQLSMESTKTHTVSDDERLQPSAQSIEKFILKYLFYLGRLILLIGFGKLLNYDWVSLFAFWSSWCGLVVRGSFYLVLTLYCVVLLGFFIEDFCMFCQVNINQDVWVYSQKEKISCSVSKLHSQFHGKNKILSWLCMH